MFRHYGSTIPLGLLFSSLFVDILLIYRSDWNTMALRFQISGGSSAWIGFLVAIPTLRTRSWFP
jgi:hypothetical protein